MSTALTDRAKHEAKLAKILSGAQAEEDFGRLRGWKRVNGHGYDYVVGPKETKVEVRSRLMGTDNDDRGPRITMTPLKMRVAAFLAWVHYDRLGRLVRAWIVPVSAIRPLYERYEQACGKAHLPWRDLVECPGARDVTTLLSI